MCLSSRPSLGRLARCLAVMEETREGGRGGGGEGRREGGKNGRGEEGRGLPLRRREKKESE